MPGLDLANVVVVAHEFNPSMMSEHWLVRKGILPEDGGDRRQMYIPGFTNVTTSDFAIEARPDRVQFTLVDPYGDAQGLITDKLGAIVRSLPETPYRAIGLNFYWSAVTADRQKLATGLRQMFVKDGSRIYDFFREDDAHFGAYLSKDVLGLRLKLDIKPITADRDGTPVEGLAYVFNFHRDTSPESAVEQIEEALGQWTRARARAQEIFEETTRWLTDDDPDCCS